MRALALVMALFALSAAAQADEWSSPPFPTEPAPTPPPTQPPPPEQQGVLVPKSIANAPLEPELPEAAPPRPEEYFGYRFGPMGHLALNFHLGDGVPPGFGGALGLRFALLPRSRAPDFNVAASGFFGLESVNFVPVLGPGVRFELMGVRGPVLIPYLSLSAFGQALVPVNGALASLRAGLALSWNLAAAAGSGRGSWWGHFGNWGGGGRDAWLIIPVAIVVAIVATVIAFGDLRVFVQTSPTGNAVFGLSVGAGF